MISRFVQWFSEMPPPSIWQGVRIVPPDNLVPVEEVLLAAR